MKMLATVIAAYVVLTTLPVVAQGGPPCAPAQGTVSVSETVGVTWIDCSLSSTSVTLQCSPSACRVTLVRVSGVTVTVNLIGSPVDNTWRNISIMVVDSVFTNTMGIGSVDGTGLATPPTLVNLFIGMYNVSSTSSGASAAVVPIGSAVESGNVQNASITIANCTVTMTPSASTSLPAIVGQIIFSSTSSSTVLQSASRVSIHVVNTTIIAPNNGQVGGILATRPLAVSDTLLWLSNSNVLLNTVSGSRVAVASIMTLALLNVPTMSLTATNVTILGQMASVTLGGGACIAFGISIDALSLDATSTPNTNFVTTLSNVSISVTQGSAITVTPISKPSGMGGVAMVGNGVTTTTITGLQILLADSTLVKGATTGNPAFTMGGVAIGTNTGLDSLSALVVNQSTFTIVRCSMLATASSSTYATAVGGIALCGTSLLLTVVGNRFDMEACSGGLQLGIRANAAAGVGVWLISTARPTATNVLVYENSISFGSSGVTFSVSSGGAAIAGISVFNPAGVLAVSVSDLSVSIWDVSSWLASGPMGATAVGGFCVYNNCPTADACAVAVTVMLHDATLTGTNVTFALTSQGIFNSILGLTAGWSNGKQTASCNVTVSRSEMHCTNCDLRIEGATAAVALLAIATTTATPGNLQINGLVISAVASTLTMNNFVTGATLGAYLMCASGAISVNNTWISLTRSRIKCQTSEPNIALANVLSVNAHASTGSITDGVMGHIRLQSKESSITIQCSTGPLMVASVTATSVSSTALNNVTVKDVDIAVLTSVIAALTGTTSRTIVCGVASGSNSTRVSLCLCNTTAVATGSPSTSFAAGVVPLLSEARIAVVNSSMGASTALRFQPAPNVDWPNVPLNGTSFIVNVWLTSSSTLGFVPATSLEAMTVVASGVYDGTTADSNLNALFLGARALNATTVADADMLSLLNSTSTNGLSCGRWYDEYWMPQAGALRRHVTHTTSLAVSRRNRTTTREVAAPTPSKPPTSPPPSTFAPSSTSSPRQHTRTLVPVSTAAAARNTTMAPTHVPRRHTHTATLVRTTAPASTPSAASSTAADVITHAGIDATTAQSITVTAYGSAVIASALSPTVATKASAASRLVGSAVCEVFGGGNDLPTPDYTQVVPCPMVGDLATDVQSGAAVLVTSAVCLLSLLATKCAERWNASHPKAEVERWSVSFSNACVGICLCYWVPNAMSMAVLVLVHGGGAARAMGAVGLVVLAAYVVALVKVCLPRPSASGAATGGASFFGDVLDAFFMGARDVSRPLIRMYTFEDVGVAIAIAMLSGVSPSTVGGCTAVGAAMLLVTMLHCGYLCVVRPAEDRLELALSLVNGFLLLGLALATIAALINGSIFMPVLAYVLVATNAAFIVQTGLLAASAVLQWLQSLKQPRNNEATAAGDELLLLRVPDLVAITNPLRDHTVPHSL